MILDDLDLLDRFVDAVLDLDAFLAEVLGVEDEDEPLHRRQRTEAYSILSTCTPVTPRAVIAWAAGVLEAGHVLHLARPEITEESLQPSQSGGSLDYGRWYNADRKGLRVTTGGSRETVAEVTWKRVANLFVPGTITPALRDEINQALTERRRRTREYKPGASMRWTPERELEQEAWHEIEDQCYELGARIWERARPAEMRAKTR